MIDEIRVQNLALIRNVELFPGTGLTVLTGETGAGKTALLSALKLLMGERADKDSVREGEEALEVAGRFFFDDEETVVTRRVNAEGRSRVNINGAMASVGELVALIAPRIDLCSQHAHQQLMKTATHIQLLDAWGNDLIAPELSRYQEAFDKAEAAARELQRVREASETSLGKLEDARFVLQRIDTVDPQPGEYEALLADLNRAENAETLALGADGAYEALSGEGGSLDGLNAAIASLDSAARYDATLSAQADSLREAGYVLEDVAREMRVYRDSIDFDSETLARQQERMAAFQGLMRSYGPRMEDVLRAREEAADLVSLVDDGAQRVEAARKALDAAESELALAAETLADARKDAAPHFAEAVTAQMQRLEMGDASLVCEVQSLDRSHWTRNGSQSVEFLFQPGASMHPRPFVKIASGGEVSRVMLAIKVVLGSEDNVDTLVFDEVDAGVGGATAIALANVLADLAQSHQVIVVTHLAQVAVAAQTHYVVRRKKLKADEEDSDENALPETELVLVEGDARIAEIARMLSGDASDTALTHAREMLEAAAR